MGELIDFPDKFFYVFDGNKPIGCGTDDLSIRNEGSKVNITVSELIEKSDLKQLMIMWLALNYPDVLKYDEEN